MPAYKSRKPGRFAHPWARNALDELLNGITRTDRQSLTFAAGLCPPCCMGGAGRAPAGARVEGPGPHRIGACLPEVPCSPAGPCTPAASPPKLGPLCPRPFSSGDVIGAAGHWEGGDAGAIERLCVCLCVPFCSHEPSLIVTCACDAALDATHPGLSFQV